MASSEVVELHLGPESAPTSVELAGNEVLQKETAFVGQRSIQRPSEERVPYAQVEQVEPRVLHECGPRRPAPRRDPKRDQRILEDLDIAARGLVCDRSVAAELSDVQDRSGGRGHEVQESRVAADVSNQSLGLNLLAQVRIGVGTQDPRRAGSDAMPRKLPVASI
jgi:hypothetical protein